MFFKMCLLIGCTSCCWIVFLNMNMSFQALPVGWYSVYFPSGDQEYCFCEHLYECHLHVNTHVHFSETMSKIMVSGLCGNSMFSFMRWCQTVSEMWEYSSLSIFSLAPDIHIATCATKILSYNCI